MLPSRSWLFGRCYLNHGPVEHISHRTAAAIRYIPTMQDAAAIKRTQYHAIGMPPFVVIRPRGQCVGPEGSAPAGFVYTGRHPTPTGREIADATLRLSPTHFRPHPCP